MTATSIGALRTANEHLGDFERLNLTFQEEGYLFFRGVLDLQEVHRVKSDFVRVLQEQGIME